MATDALVPITMRALLQRVQRALRAREVVLRKGRGKAQAALGAYYVVSTRDNRVERGHVDPVALAKELGVLKLWEAIEDAEKQGEHDASY